MKVLISKKFIIPFDSGVIVIRHWRLNNYLRNDRHTATQYQDEYAQLYVNNNVYELESTQKSTMLPDGRQVVYPDKNSIDKNSIDKISSSTADDDSVMKFYLNNINQAITPYEANVLESYENEMSSELIIYAMQKAVEHKARTLKYIQTILNKWKAKGISTLAEAKEERKPSEETTGNRVHNNEYVDLDSPEFYANLKGD